MTRILVLASHKGGVGKTSAAVTISAGLARRGYKVLAVDLDPQGSLSDFLGLPPTGSVYRLLIDRVPLAELAIPAGPGRPGLDLLRGNHQTAAAATLLIGQPGLDYRLRRALAGAGYDWIVIDTPPSLGLMVTLAFVASDFLLVPTELSFAATLGVAQVVRSMELLRQEVDMTLRLIGVLPNKWDRRLNESEAQLKALAARFPGRVWLPIPTDAKAAECVAYAQTLWEYAPSCAAVLGRDDKDGQRVGGYEQALDRLLAEAKR